MKFKTIDEGFIAQHQSGSSADIPGTARCVLTAKGELVGCCLLSRGLGRNDMKQMIIRSQDGGKSWRKQGLLWPYLQDAYSIFGSISRAPDGECFFYGTRTKIETPGESFWSEATQGLKQNEIIWASSKDDGLTWTDPAVIPMPIPGSAEVAGAMCVTRNKIWLGSYAPYNTFDSALRVARNQVVVVRSSDQGLSWSHTPMLRFDDVNTSAAETWVIELTDGRLLGTAWHLNPSRGTDYPNVYSLSLDKGLTWQPARSTGIMGQSAALAPLPDGRALFIYNQRKHGEVGVWLAAVKPTESDFGIEANEIIWKAQTGTQGGSSGLHTEWTDFSFGEPSITVLPDNILLAALWCNQPGGQGTYYVKLKMLNDEQADL